MKFAAWAIVLLLAGTPALANGKYFPRAVFETPPSIPVQRAIVVYRDGVETLVVESSYESPSERVGWVLPLPKDPEKLEVGEPGMIRSAAMAMRAELHNSRAGSWQAYGSLLGLFAIVAAISIAVKDDARRLSSLTQVLVVLLVGGCLVSIFLPSLGVSRGYTGSEGVEVRSSSRVGNYDVSILWADHAAALDGWLESNGLRTLDAASRTVVDQYIAEGWCFAVAVIDAAAEAATPHPLRISFATDRPVFPMRMTAGSGEKTHVDLVVVSDKQASAPHLRTIAADRFKPEKDGAYASAATKLIIGSPDVASLLWPDCVVTRLSGDLTAARMDQDVWLTMHDLTPQRLHLYSKTARRESLLATSLTGACIAIFTTGIIFHKRRRPRSWEMWLLVLILFSTVALTAARAARMEVVAFPVVDGMHPIRFLALLRHDAGDLASESRIDSTFSDEQFQAFRDRFRDENPFTGQPIQRERSPGNVDVQVIGGATYLMWYDENGRPYELIELPPPGSATTKEAS